MFLEEVPAYPSLLYQVLEWVIAKIDDPIKNFNPKITFIVRSGNWKKSQNVFEKI